MMLEWFNARDAVAVGNSLADSFLKSSPPRSGQTGSQSAHRRAAVQQLLHRAVLDARPLKLNLFKRAKLVGSFKWRLTEHGFDPASVEELTRLMLLQLSGGGQLPVVADAKPAEGAAKAPRKRIDPLLQGVDVDFSKGEYEEAVAKLQEVLAIKPDHAFAQNKLGDALCRLGRYSAAEQAFRRAIQIEPRRADAHFNLGNVLRWRGDFKRSEAVLRRAVKLDPRNSDPLTSLAHTLCGLDRVSEAKSLFEAALRINARDPSAYCGLAWLASMGGRFEEAESLLGKALEADPACSDAQSLLVDQRRMTAADKRWLDTTQRMLARDLPPVEEARLRFAAGKYFNDIGNYAQAFDQYKRANELSKLVASAPYDRAARVAWVDDVIRAYSPDRLARRAEGASDSELPVFVVGMMRSGTSLVEQIIASHPEAVAGGELVFWSAATDKHSGLMRHGPPDGNVVQKLAVEYLRELGRLSKAAARAVDKAPVNSDFLGLIHSVFPKARFIYMRRDPIDTCLSSFFQNFANAAAFTMDLGDLAHYYREHHRLVSHWRSVLPKNVFLEVPYAELVADPERWSRRIIEFIGLEWDPKVLKFDKTERAVLTASNWQVRQKMYSSSVGRWKNYQKFIGPLLKLRDLV